MSLAVAPGVLVPPAAAQSVAGPRPLGEAERQAVSLAMVYFEEGAAGWWQRLSTDAPLRELGQDAARLEIAVRAGPRTGATWELQTPAERYAENTAIFSIVNAVILRDLPLENPKELVEVYRNVERWGATAQE